MMEKRNLMAGAVSLALGLLVMFALLMWQQARLEQGAADTQLQAANKVQALVEAQLQKDLDARGELIASNQAFIGYITQAMGGIMPGTPVDTASIADLLEERREQLGLAIAAVVDRDGQLIASRDQLSERRDLAHDPMFARALADNTVTHGLWVEAGKIFFTSLLPLDKYGSDAGFLLVGMPVDEALAKVIAETFNGEAGLYVMTGDSPALASSSNIYILEKNIPADVRRELLLGGHGFSVNLRGETYRADVARLFDSGAGRALLLVRTGGSTLSAVKLALTLILGAAAGLVCFWLSTLLRRRRNGH